MKSLYLFIGLLICGGCPGQSVPVSLGQEMIVLEKDPQFTHATIGLYVVNKSGSMVFSKNAELGMAPASTQKVVTSVAAFELLGKDYQFKTQVAFDGPLKGDKVDGNIVFIGGGDPTLGSNRWASTKQSIVFQKVNKFLADKNVQKISGKIVVDENRFLFPPIPNGWIWEDMGNYYGAGAWGLSWLENKYEVHLASVDEINKPVRVITTLPVSLSKKFNCNIVSAAKGTGDNAYLFSAPYSDMIFANGTIPAGEKDFIIYGALPQPSKVFIDAMGLALGSRIENKDDIKSKSGEAREIIGTIYSPPLDSVNYWFLKESVNLFGEALVKAMALEQGKKVSTSSGIEIVRDFWLKRGIEKSALKILDGSGLSPANRLTPKSLVQVLHFAIDKPWFDSFNQALPDMNGIKMKSGFIGGVRAYTGYIKSKSGEEYTFAFIINNFDGSAAGVREKMYRVLNLLK